MPVHCRTAYIADRHLTFRPHTANARRKTLIQLLSQWTVNLCRPKSQDKKKRMWPIWIWTWLSLQDSMEAWSKRVCGLQRGLPSVFTESTASLRPIKDLTIVEMSVNCSFTPSCLHTVVTISLWHAHPAYSAAMSFLFLILPATARVHSPR